MVEFGGECDPREVGLDAARLGTAIEQVRSRRGVAQLCVIKDGRVVVDRSFGCAPESLFWLFSASKPYVAILVHQLVESGVLHLDDEVAAYWPQFAGEGKDGITVRDVLRHRSGLTTVGSYLSDVRAMSDWDRSLRRIEQARRTYAIGTVAYSPLASGFVLGELVQRITRHPLPDVLREAVLGPLGVHNTYLGQPSELWGRQVPLKVSGVTGPVVQSILNRRSTREAVIPAGGVSTTARDLAELYLMLLRGGIGTSGRVLRPESIAAAVTPTSEGEVDRWAQLPIRWGQGFQLARPDSAFGQLSSPRTFGHNGSNCCIGWADPDRQLAYAYLTDHLGRGPAERAHHAAVADRVLAAAG